MLALCRISIVLLQTSLYCAFWDMRIIYFNILEIHFIFSPVLFLASCFEDVNSEGLKNK